MERGEKSHLLFEIAETQQGYFTSADAKRLGYDYPHQHFHVKQRNWIRVDHGIYRLKRFPAAKRRSDSLVAVEPKERGLIARNSGRTLRPWRSAAGEDSPDSARQFS